MKNLCYDIPIGWGPLSLHQPQHEVPGPPVRRQGDQQASHQGEGLACQIAGSESVRFLPLGLPEV